MTFAPSPVATPVASAATGATTFGEPSGPETVPAPDSASSSAVPTDRPPMAAHFLARPDSDEYQACLRAFHSVFAFSDAIILAVLARCDLLVWWTAVRLVAHSLEHDIRWRLAAWMAPSAPAAAPAPAATPVCGSPGSRFGHRRPWERAQ